MNIVPAEATLTGSDSQSFEVRDVPHGATLAWALEPHDRGRLHNGVYTAPPWVWKQREAFVVVIAKNAAGGDDIAKARITLSNGRFWVTILFGFLAVLGALLLVALIWLWPASTESKGPATSGEAASAWSTPNPPAASAAPSVSAATTASTPPAGSMGGPAAAPSGSPPAASPGGPPAAPSVAQSSGHSSPAPKDAKKATADSPKPEDERPTKTASTEAQKAQPEGAEVALIVDPPHARLRGGESIRLVLKTKAQQFAWSGDICDRDGICEAPTGLLFKQETTATVTTSGPEASATVTITMVPWMQASTRFLLLVLICGAMGGVVHAVNSLVGYVGGNSFVPRWGLFYLARPFVGATMAFFVYVLVKSELFSVENYGDAHTVAAVAALTGLFSDNAAQKLKELFDVLIGPRRDDRTDKMDPSTRTRPARPSPPSVTSTAPALTKQGPTVVTVHGSGFSDKSRALIGGDQRPVTFRSASELSVQLETKDVAASGTLQLVVENPNGDRSAPYPVVVQ